MGRPFVLNRPVVRAAVRPAVWNATGADDGYPPITHILEVGDSITDRSTVLDTAGWTDFVQVNPSGWGAALRIVSGQRLLPIARGATGLTEVPGNDLDFGYSGINASQYVGGLGAGWSVPSYVAIEAVEAAAASAPPGTVIVCHIGTNDIPSTDAATVAARVFALWDRLVATGLRVIGTDILQRGATYSGWTTTLRDRVNDTNALLRAGWASRGLWAYRQWDDLIDKDGSGYAAATEFPVDQLHPTSRTGFRLAVDLWDFLQPHVTADPYAIPASGSASWVTPNPYCTGGTTLATSWENSSLGTVGVDVNFSKVVDGDGTNWQRVDRLVALTFETSGVRSRITSGLPAVGTRCRATARIRMDDGEPCQSVAVLVQQVNATAPAFDWMDTVTHGGSTTASSPIRGVDGSWRFLSEPFEIETGTTQLWLLVALKCTAAASIEFTEAGIFLDP